MAFDQRFAMVLVGSSGKGGATLLRRNFGEAVENLTGGEYYWMAGNFMKYGASEATFGSKTPGDIPVDSNELIALVRAAAYVYQLWDSRRRAMPSGWTSRGASWRRWTRAGCSRLLGARVWTCRGLSDGEDASGETGTAGRTTGVAAA